MQPLENLEARVETFLGQLGLDASYRRHGVSVVVSGEVVLYISCFEQLDRTWCRISAVVLEDVEPSLELLHELLHLNQRAIIGAFVIFEDRTLVCAATLPGSHLHADDFTDTLRYVAGIADEAAEELRPLAGGRTAISALGRPSQCG